MNDEKRIAYIDLAKGFCICLVVFFHTKGVLGCHYVLDPFFASFRLPLYFFLSGLFFKDYGSFRNFLIKKTNRLLIPFFFFYIIFSVIVPNALHIFFGKTFETVVGWSSLWAFIYPGVFPNIPIWFLWCLFIVNVLFWFLRIIAMKYGSCHKDVLLLVLCLITGLTGYLLLEYDVMNVGYILSALLYLPFFYIGYIFKKHEAITYLQSLSEKKVIFGSVIFLVITLLMTIVIAIHSVYTFYIFGITGVLFIMLLSRSIGRLPFFSYVGRYSIIVLVTHGIIINVCSPLFVVLAKRIENNSLTTLLITILILLSYYLIIPLMIRYFPYVTAQRPLLREKPKG